MPRLLILSLLALACRQGTPAPSCFDGVKNGTETGVDCGGPGVCEPCEAGASCTVNDDCESGSCAQGLCAVPRCDDQLENGKETAVDCGGDCAPCALGQSCLENVDCVTAACVNGACVEGCSAPLIACGGRCIDPRHDPAHCGRCDVACSPGTRCLAGQCGVLCSGATNLCAGRCVDLMNDVLNCGMCGRSCPANAPCVQGQCRPACEVGQQPCNGECVITASDLFHCGGCNRPCPMGSLCSQGQCRGGCTPPASICGGGASCAETLFDPDNCNACGTVCPPVPNAQRACLAGSCARGPCQAGWRDCNPNPTDGCETDVTGDTFNCGRCGLVCPPTFGCDAGQCVPMP